MYLQNEKGDAVPKRLRSVQGTERKIVCLSLCHRRESATAERTVFTVETQNESEFPKEPPSQRLHYTFPTFSKIDFSSFAKPQIYNHSLKKF